MDIRTAVVTALALASPAFAATFSFSSDRNTDGPTLASLQAGAVVDGRPFDLSGRVIVDFLYDSDEDGPAGPAFIPASFEFSATTSAYAAVAVSGGFLHSWTLAGEYRFIDLRSGEPFFTATFANALMSNFSDSPSLLSSSGSLQSSLPADASLAYQPGGLLAGLDLSAAPSFSFSMSGLRSATNGGRVPIDAGGAFLAPWKSESSWSARAVPAPAGLALPVVAALPGLRRKR